MIFQNIKNKFRNISPIRRNFIANLFGIAVNLLNQVVLVPFYILFWGNELYSDWIVLSALTTIFAMSDVGLNNVIQNRFSIKLSEGNKKECDSLLVNNHILISITLIATLLLSVIFVSFFDITKVMSLHMLSRDVASWVFIILIFKVFINMYSGVLNAVYRATHKASISVYMDQVGNFVVAIITLLCVLWKTNVIILSLLICLPQLFLLLIKSIHSKKYYNFSFRFKDANFGLLKELLIPSFTFMSFPIGNMLVLEGYTLIVNAFFGANSVVLYNTTRTLCNFVKSFFNTIQASVWPEYSIAYGQRNFPEMRRLHRKILKITCLLSLIISSGILIFGPFIFRIWTQNAVEFDYSLMTVYVIALFIESLWAASAVTLMATNNHSKLGILYLLSASFSISIAVVLMTLAPDSSLSLMTSSLILLHIIVACYTINAGFKFTQDHFYKLFA